MYCISPLTDSDLPAVRAIFMQTFPRSDDADFNAAWRTKECNYSLGLYYKATLVGFAITCKDSAAAAARLWFIAVAADHRSGGTGTQLLTAVISAVQRDYCRLTLTPDNSERIINWYKRHGFKITKTMPFIHRDIPTCWMELDTSEPSSPSSLASTETASVRSSSMDGLEI